MEHDKLVPYDIGCIPRPSGSAELVLQRPDRCTVAFLACTSQPSSTGFLEDLGVAVVDFSDCLISRFGYPNEEGCAEHPLYTRGLESTFGVGEVLHSSWNAEMKKQLEGSAMRLWNRPESECRFPPRGERPWDCRHFVLVFKDSVFECLRGAVTVSFVASTPAAAMRDICTAME